MPSFHFAQEKCWGRGKKGTASCLLTPDEDESEGQEDAVIIQPFEFANMDFEKGFVQHLVVMAPAFDALPEQLVELDESANEEGSGNESVLSLLQ